MLWFAVSSGAFAQDDTLGGFDAHGFRYVSADADPRDPFAFLRAGDIEPLQWSIAALGEYASRPLLFVAQDSTETKPLQNLVAVNLTGELAPVDRVLLNVSMPTYLLSTSAEGTSGPALGDLRGSLLLMGLEPSQTAGFGLGVTGTFDVPTGTPSRWLGTRGVAGTVGLTSSVEIERYTFSWMADGRFAPNSAPEERPTPTLGGDMVEAGASLGAIVSDGVGVGIEGRISWPVDESVRTAIGIPAMAEATFRYATDGGGYVSGGLGTGLSRGAGASPLRVVLGGGFGGRGNSGNKDTDGDGFVDSDEACPTEAETLNQYRDDDGCPDALPQIEFVARRADREENAAALTVDRPDGTTSQGLGKIFVGGLPGETFTAHSKFGACFGGTSEAKIPAEGRVVVTVPVARLDTEVVVVVTDATGRPLDAAVARYIVEDDACAPADTTLVAGKGVHIVGAGPTTVFVTAPGYGVHQVTLTPPPGERTLIDARLSPTQVALRDGVFALAKPIEFRGNTAVIVDASQPLLDQLASLILSNASRPFEVSAWAPSGATAKRLSQQRAEALVAGLVGLGVPPELLVAVGKGGKPSSQSDWASVRVLPQ